MNYRFGLSLKSLSSYGSNKGQVAIDEYINLPVAEII